MGASKPGLNRREALLKMGAGAAGVASVPLWVESLCAQARSEAHAHTADAAMAAQNWTPKVLTDRQNDTVVALTEAIIPETDTPGAKAARVNRFIDRVLADAPAAERDSFLRGLTWIDQRSQNRLGKDIAAASPTELTALLTPLSDAGRPASDDETGATFFRALKSMTISGYYTTEIGLRQELGDDGQLFLIEFKGCDHPEHR